MKAKLNQLFKELKMSKTILSVYLLTLSILASAANAESANQFDGLWVVDPKATEEYVKTTTPDNPNKLAEWFGIAGGFMAILTYQFQGDIGVSSTLRQNQFVEFHKVSNQNHSTTFAHEADAKSKAQTISISMLGKSNIRISSPELPEMSYIVWKLGPDLPTLTSRDYMTTISTEWMASIKNIQENLKSRSK